jgi:hypothetical protein
MRLSNAVLLLLASGASGCFEPRPDASRYYTLSAEAGPADTGRPNVPSLGIGPLALPPYLDRNEFATRVGPEQLAYSTSDRWAAPLKELFLRALSEDLRTRAPAAQLVTWPWNLASPPDLAVSIDVERFEVETSGAAVLHARFALRAGAGGPVLASGETRFREEIPALDAAKAAAALSRGLAALAGDVAQAAARIAGH